MHKVLLLILSLAIIPAYGIDDTTAISLKFRVNSTVLEHGVQHNAVMMNRIDSIASARRVDSITITAYASPEGPEEHNETLAEQRAKVAYQYVKDRFPAAVISLQPEGENWSGLIRAVTNDTVIPDRQRVLDILTEPVGHRTIKEVIRRFAGTPTYNYIVNSVLPQLREACITFHYTRIDTLILKSKALPAITVEPLVLARAEIPVARYLAVPRSEHKRFAIKTNLIYLAALMINVEGEYYFSPKFSLNLEWQYAWWDNSQQHRYYRIATVSPEFRYWFHRKSMDQGHFGGVYVAAGIYEFMRNERLGIQGEFFVAAGLSYGYMMPLSRALNLEFSLGVGYMMTEFRQYHYDAGCYVYDLTKRNSYFGLTKAKVSLVFPLGRGRTR